MRLFILLDRSGSMSARWREMLGALELYFDSVSDQSTRVTLLAFDHAGTNLVINDARLSGLAETGHAWKNVVDPRGMTPLLDAVGELDKYVTERAKKKAVITIITDGAENASHKLSRADVKKIISRWQEKGYDVTFMGAAFDAFDEAGSIGIGRGHTISSADLHHDAMGQTLAMRASSYNSTGQSAEFTDSDRARAAGEDTADANKEATNAQ